MTENNEINEIKIPKRITTALLNSISAGVTPRIGLEYMAVGRKAEISTMLDDLANIAEDGSVFRFIVGRYGSGKSFLLQIIRNYAMERGYVVADADLSPERKLTGSKGHGINTYKELLQNLSTKVRPDGGGLAAILEKWISGIHFSVMHQPDPDNQMEIKIAETVNSLDNLVHGFDFAGVLTRYWQGWKSGDAELQSSTLKWLRGEYPTRTDAYSELGLRSIIDDSNWFDYIKLLSSFIKSAGYQGFLMLLDEGVNLYKITNTISRNNNYEKLLNMFNDAMQGKAAGLGIYMGGTPQFIEDTRRGLFSYEALRTRLAGSRFSRDGLRDMQSPLIYLEKLTYEEIFVLLKKVLDIHARHYIYIPAVSDDDLVNFMKIAAGRLGAEELLTPREILRDFVGILNIIRQNPDISFGSMLEGDLFRIEKNEQKTDESPAMEFTL